MRVRVCVYLNAIRSECTYHLSNVVQLKIAWWWILFRVLYYYYYYYDRNTCTHCVQSIIIRNILFITLQFTNFENNPFITAFRNSWDTPAVWFSLLRMVACIVCVLRTYNIHIIHEYFLFSKYERNPVLRKLKCV